MITISEKIIPKRAPKPEKIEQVQQLSDLLDRSTGILVTDYRGFTVKEKAELTRRLREVNAEYHVVKNTLFRLAYAERGEDPGALVAGPTAIAFALDEPVGAAKVVTDFVKEKRKGVVRGGIIDGRVFDQDAVVKLSQLPPRQQLIGEVVGAIQGPLYGLVWSLQGVLGNFVRTVQAIHDQKAEAGG